MKCSRLFLNVECNGTYYTHNYSFLPIISHYPRQLYYFNSDHVDEMNKVCSCETTRMTTV